MPWFSRPDTLQAREGELVFGVAHIFASFNDTFVHVTDLSGKCVPLSFHPAALPSHVFNGRALGGAADPPCLRVHHICPVLGSRGFQQETDGVFLGVLWSAAYLWLVAAGIASHTLSIVASSGKPSFA